MAALEVSLLPLKKPNIINFSLFSVMGFFLSTRLGELPVTWNLAYLESGI